MNPHDTINTGTHMMVNNIDEQNMLLDYLKPDMRVLEFGMGISTIAIAARCKEVVSIEHDRENFDSFKAGFQAFGNVQPVYVAANGAITPDYDDGTADQFRDYVEAPKMFIANEKFDVVFVDGRARVACAAAAAKSYLNEGGVIFIHDYKHPDQRYRRPEYEVVESFLKLEKHVFAMAMFSVRSTNSSAAVPSPLERAEGEVYDPAVQKVINDQIKELGGTPWPDEEQLTTSNEQIIAPNEHGNDDFATPVINDQPTANSQQLIADKSTCWYDPASCAYSNDFFDKHIKTHDITRHMEPFTKLLNCVIADAYNKLLDLACGSGMLADWVPGFSYYGADLPHVIAGCALRNYPGNWFRGCDIVDDDISWINQFDVVCMSGVIDIMEHPLYVFRKVMMHAKKFVLIHRQEISDSKETHVGNGPGYGDRPSFHSVINRNNFNEIVNTFGFRIVAEVACSFSNWENGGSSFLLERIK